MNIQQSFQILGLSRGASPQAAKSAYRKLVKTFHPDRFALDPDQSRSAEETIKEINDAYGRVRSYFSSKRSQEQPPVKPTPTFQQDISRARPSGMAEKKSPNKEHPGKIKQPSPSFKEVFKEVLLSQKKKKFHSHDSTLRYNMFQHAVRNYNSYSYSRNPIRKHAGPIEKVKPVPPISPVGPR